MIFQILADKIFFWSSREKNHSKSNKSFVKMNSIKILKNLMGNEQNKDILKKSHFHFYLLVYKDYG